MSKYCLVPFALVLTSCWMKYTDNPTQRPEVTNAYKAPPTGPIDEVDQWAGQMFDARLSLEILDSKCQSPIPYSDLEFQIRKKGKILLKRQLQKRTFVEKVYLPKDEFDAVLLSFSRNIIVAESSFLFEGKEKSISLSVKCRE